MLKFLKSKKEFVLFLKGKPWKITSDNKNYEVVEKMLEDGASEDELLAVVDIKEVVKSLTPETTGGFEISNEEVKYNNETIPQDCAEHISKLHEAGQLDESFTKFIQLLQKNPNPAAVKDLYQFILKGKMPITEDGRFCAYRVCTSDFKDKHTGKFDNSIGAIVTMPRSACNSNRNETCSSGLHFCSASYIKGFRSGGDRLLMVAISPEDVVAIPNDYNDSKGRCCKFEVIKEIELGAITGVGKVRVSKTESCQAGMKSCSKCKQVKVLDDFSNDKKSKSGKRSSCKACDAASKKKPTKDTKPVAVVKPGVSKQPKKSVVAPVVKVAPVVATKICTKCQCSLPYEEFFKDKTRKDGFRGSCKACDKISRSK